MSASPLPMSLFDFFRFSWCTGGEDNDEDEDENDEGDSILCENRRVCSIVAFIVVVVVCGGDGGVDAFAVASVFEVVVVL